MDSPHCYSMHRHMAVYYIRLSIYIVFFSCILLRFPSNQRLFEVNNNFLSLSIVSFVSSRLSTLWLDIALTVCSWQMRVEGNRLYIQASIKIWLGTTNQAQLLGIHGQNAILSCLLIGIHLPDAAVMTRGRSLVLRQRLNTKWIAASSQKKQERWNEIVIDLE